MCYAVRMQILEIYWCHDKSYLQELARSQCMLWILNLIVTHDPGTSDGVLEADAASQPHMSP